MTLLLGIKGAKSIQSIETDLDAKPLIETDLDAKPLIETDLDAKPLIELGHLRMNLECLRIKIPHIQRLQALHSR